MSNPNPPNPFSSKMTEEIVAKICESLGRGTAPETAAIAAGITLRTYRNWMKAGREWITTHDENEVPSPEALFVMRTEHAIARGEETLGQRVYDADEARITLEILARRFPKNWGKRDRLDIGNPEGEIFEMFVGDLTFLPPADLQHLRRIFETIALHRAGGDVIEMPARREIGA